MMIQSPDKWIWGAVAALSLAWVSPAIAQPGDARARAIALYDEGNRLYKAGQTLEAEQKYEEAWKLQPSFEIASNLATAELVLGQTAEAAHHLAHALRVLPAGRPDSDRAKIERALGDARSRVGTFDVQTDPGATVLVDGVPVGVMPLAVPVFLMPGEHTIAVEREGRRGSKQITATAGMSTMVAIDVSPVTSSPPLTAIPTPTPPPTGGGEAGDPGLSWVPGALLGGAGLVAIGVGAGLLVAAGSASDESETIRDALLEDGVACGPNIPDPRCEEGQAADERHGTLQVAGGLVMGLGLTAAATGAVLLFVGATDDEATDASRTTLRPTLGLDHAGLLLNGTF